MKVVTRFAPSPTGMLHIGGARTALFNYLFSRHTGGKFLLRIEDTDKERSSDESYRTIVDGLQWLGISWDEDLVFQSKNEAKHIAMAQQLLAEGFAYSSFERKITLDTGEVVIEKTDNPAIRLKVPKGQTIVKDLLRGNVVFDNSAIEDVVLLRSNGKPTYTMAVVADDISMGITHVIRGDDHLTNTPKQLLIYSALKRESPVFAHIPLIFDIDGKKLSKRRGAAAVGDYEKIGYLPEAFVNYLAFLGWSPRNHKEIMDIKELITVFDPKDINLSPARFDLEKLNYVNLQHIQNMPDDKLLLRVKDSIEKKIGRNLNDKDKDTLIKIMPHAKKQNSLNAIADLLILFLEDAKIEISTELREVLVKNTETVLALREFMKFLNVDSFKHDFDAFLQDKGYKMKDVGPILRIALIGKKDSCPIGAIVDALGKDLCLKRINSITP